MLKRVIQKANDMGYDRFNVGPEAEFFLFKTDEEGKPTTQTNDEAGYFDLGPPGSRGVHPAGDLHGAGADGL